MIPKVLFIALVCAAHIQGRPGIFPRLNEPVENDSSVPNLVVETRERSNRNKPIVNDWTNVDYEDYVNDNLKPSKSGNGNVNGGHVVLTVHSGPEVNNKVATQRVVTNDHSNNIPVHEKIATAKPVTEKRKRIMGVAELADTLGQGVEGVVKESVHSLDRDIGSVLQAGRTIVKATGSIIDSKIQLVLSVPHIGEPLYAALGKN